MKAKEFKELVNKIDDNEDINFAVFNEYGSEVEGVEFKKLREGYGGWYLILSAENE